MKRKDSEPSIEYDDVLDMIEKDTGVVTSSSSSSNVQDKLIQLPEGLDCEQTRTDQIVAEKLQGLKLIATFLAIDLFVENHEPFQKNEFCFGERIVMTADPEEDVQEFYATQMTKVEENAIPNFHVKK
jgi:hypothetical protein